MKRIKELRKKAGFTQESLAIMVGVVQSAVSAWEADDDNMPSADKLPIIAKVLGCSIDDLFTEEGETP